MRGRAALAMWAQRQRWPLPKWVRAPARELVRRLRGRDALAFPPVDDWSRPLVGDAFTAPLPQPVAAAAEAPAVRAATTTLHCLLVTSRLEGGGMGEVVAFLAEGLPAFGVATSVLRVATFDPESTRDGPVADRLRARGIEVATAERNEVGAWLRAHPTDVISAHGTPDWLVDEAIRAGVPYVETLHNPEHLTIHWRGEVTRRHDSITLVAISEHTRRTYLRNDPEFPPERVVTIPNVVNGVRMQPVDRGAARAWLGLGDEFLFLSLARHSKQKNVYGLLHAFDEVAARRPDAMLLVAGGVDDPEYPYQVRSLHDRLAHRDRIHLRDNFEHPAVLLAAADAFVLDSFFEGGFPLAAMEAQVAGLPVIISEVAGVAERMPPDGSAGIVVANPTGDDDVDLDAMYAALYRPQVNRAELVDAMVAVIDERERWAAARASIASAASERYRPEPCLRRYAEVFSAAAGG